MLGKISLKENEVILSNNELWSSDLYDVDSLSLLIGKNGAGKTYFLGEIVKTVTSEDSEFRNGLCEIYDSEGIEISERELNGLGVIYFTSLPYRMSFGINSKRFIDASPSLSLLNEAHNLNELAPYLNDFDIEPHAEVRRYTSYTRVLRVILELINDDVINIPCSSDFKDQISYMKGIENDIANLKELRVQSIKGRFTPALLKAQRRLKYLINNAVKELLYELENRIDGDVIFSAFSVIESRLDKKAANRKQIISVINMYLGAKVIVQDDNYSNNTVDTRLVAHFLDFIRSMSNVSQPYVFESRSSEIIASFNMPVDPFNNNTIPEISKFNGLLKMEFVNLSSGELALINQVWCISEAIKKISVNECSEVLLLIDEGDAYLHLSWQQKYISLLNKMLGRLKDFYDLKSLQVIIATHSPLLATDVPNDFICRLDEKLKGNISGFAAPLYTLFKDSFDTNSIGEFAAEKITSLIERIRIGQCRASDLELISKIENSVIKDEVIRLVNKNYKNGEV